jgi:hypothetical protein
VLKLTVTTIWGGPKSYLPPHIELLCSGQIETERAGWDVPVLHTGLTSCDTRTSIPPKVENPGSTSVVGCRDEQDELLILEAYRQVDTTDRSL